MSTSYTYDKLDQPGIIEYIFHPTPSSGLPCPEEAEDIHVDVAGGVTIHIRFFPSGNLDSPCILFFHGNGEIVSDYDNTAPNFTNRGITFIAAEYRGYGSSTGTPSASTMMTDCHLLLDAVVSWRKDHGYIGKLLVMGRSLGSASAIELAFAHPDCIDALMIDSGFALTLPLLQTIGVNTDELGLKEQDGFNNLDKIKKITMATYIIHGQHDEIIAHTNASELIAESPALQKEFQTVPGAGHNTIMTVAGALYYDVMGAFIDKIGKTRRKRTGVR